MIKKPPANVGDAGNRSLIPGLGRSPGGGNGNPLQWVGESHGERSLVGYIIHGVAKSLTKLMLHVTLHILLCIAFSHGFYLCCNFCFSGSLVSKLQHTELLNFCKVSSKQYFLVPLFATELNYSRNKLSQLRKFLAYLCIVSLKCFHKILLANFLSELLVSPLN